MTEQSRTAGDEAMSLSAILDLNASAPLAADLNARRGRDLGVDASEVHRLGAQCLQVLLAARACWAADGFRFRVVAPSAEFVDGVALLGCPDLVAHVAK